MSYSDHICTNFEPTDTDKDRWDIDLREHLKEVIDRLHAENEDLVKRIKLMEQVEKPRLRNLDNKRT